MEVVATATPTTPSDEYYCFVTVTVALLFAATGSGVGEATDAVTTTGNFDPWTNQSTKIVRVGEPATNVPSGQVSVTSESVQPPSSLT